MMLFRVLCIEDEPDLRQDLAEELEALGCKVACASDGISGLKCALHESFDLIFCDVFLPGLSGLALLAELRARSGPNTETPVVFLTAYNLAGLNADVSAAGGAGHLLKPLDYSRLGDLVRSFVAS